MKQPYETWEEKCSDQLQRCLTTDWTRPRRKAEGKVYIPIRYRKALRWPYKLTNIQLQKSINHKKVFLTILQTRLSPVNTK